ncbi:MAG: hypothetical protein FWE15_00045 [Actinomycetia bacterium]|nr:hypothetical protein [Actinomycetes bacterium]
MLTQQTDTAQQLARSALAIVDTLSHQPSMYHSPVIYSVFARVRQLAHLATDAADHLIDAADILSDTREGLPIELDDDVLAVLTDQQALHEASRRFDLAASLTALGATDALATAEIYVAERRHRGFLPAHVDGQPIPHPERHVMGRGDAGAATVGGMGTVTVRRDPQGARGSRAAR